MLFQLLMRYYTYISFLISADAIIASWCWLPYYYMSLRQLRWLTMPLPLFIDFRLSPPAWQLPLPLSFSFSPLPPLLIRHASFATPPCRYCHWLIAATSAAAIFALIRCWLLLSFYFGYYCFWFSPLFQLFMPHADRHYRAAITPYITPCIYAMITPWKMMLHYILRCLVILGCFSPHIITCDYY